MEYNKLLMRQLARLNINSVEQSPDPKVWKEFLDVVSKTYVEADEERYLRDRSMAISSRELLDLNKNLEIAQHMGNLGYWEVNISNNKVYFSKELYSLFGLNPAESIPRYKQFIKLIHEEDRSHMQNFLGKAVNEDMAFETEVRIKIADSEYHWFYTKFQRFLKDDLYFLRGVAVDITDRKKDEQEILSLQNQLVISARLAGMADVAASTLHNVGNVLNSASVSATFLKERILQFKMKEVVDITSLLQEHLSQLPEYFDKDPQGKCVPEYLIALLQNIKNEHTLIDQEIDSLSIHLTHVNDIIVTQNDINRASGMNEKVFLPEVIDMALEMTDSYFAEHNIVLMKNYKKTSFVNIDKVKLLQILINLIRNAKDAVIENTIENTKVITFSIKEDSVANKIIMKIKDNGIGIPPENLTKIFTLGFTTKKHGHGFGLHMSALNAKEIGGSLNVESEGIGKGASFNLLLPNAATP